MNSRNKVSEFSPLQRAPPARPSNLSDSSPPAIRPGLTPVLSSRSCRSLGVRTIMVTGDAPATAAIVTHAVGLDGPIVRPGRFR